MVRVLSSENRTKGDVFSVNSTNDLARFEVLKGDLEDCGVEHTSGSLGLVALNLE